MIGATLLAASLGWSALGRCAQGSDDSQALRLRPKQESQADLLPDTGLIDAPTAAVIDPEEFQSQTRFFSGGGFLEYLSFGVVDGLNIGASLDVDRLVGTAAKVQARDPAPQIKYRFYDGGDILPALAVGYDGQGYGFDSVTNKYDQSARGVYLVASQELGVPGLEVHPSVNFSQFNAQSIFGTLPFSYSLGRHAAVIAEWDNLNSQMSQSRVNAGLRLYLSDNLHADLAVRSINQKGDYPDGAPRGPERIVQIWYTAHL